MIITRTPLRISFLGGATDYEDFYKIHEGMVVSSAINKYVYIGVHKHFDGKSFLLKYSKVEIGTDINKIENPLIRECMRLTGVFGVEIVSMSDVPVTGVGLGSSSSFTVGLLNALYAYKGIKKTAEELAQDACKVEIEILRDPIGKQDQYAAAYGGLRYYLFKKDNGVETEKIAILEEKKKEFNSNLLFFHLGPRESSKKILSEQKSNMKEKEQCLLNIKKSAELAKSALENGNIDEIGQLLHMNWLEKKQLAKTISNDNIDLYYKKAVEAGALGGKICGAGGGGFFIFYCKKENQENVVKALSDLQKVDFLFEDEGSKIIYDK